MVPEKCYIHNREGMRLAALLFRPAQARCVVIACHGFRGGKENSGRICSLGDKLTSRGCALLAFDFAGSGESEGDFADITLSGQASDLRAVIDWVDGQGWGPIIVLGRSFGGSTALVAAAGHEQIQGLILWSTPVFLRETFGAVIPAEYEQLGAGNPIVVQDDWGEFRLNPSFALDLVGHDMNRYLGQIGPHPVLVIHGLQDEVVKATNAEYIYKKLGDQAELHLVEDSDHRFTKSAAVREDLTVAWLEKHFLSVPEIDADTESL